MKYLLIVLLFIASVVVADPTEEEVKQKQQQCQYKAMIATTTQQTREEYFKENNVYLSWETFLHYVAEEMNLKHDEGLEKALDISKQVFFAYPTKSLPENVGAEEINKCWKEFILENTESI